MTPNILLGHDVKRRCIERAAQRLCESKARPGVRMLAVQHDEPALEGNLRLHATAFEEAGFAVESVMMPEETDSATLHAEISRLNADDSVAFIMVLMPLPGHLDFREALDAIAPHKEIEGLHLENLSRLSPLSIRPGDRLPVAPLVVWSLLDEVGFDSPSYDVVVLWDPQLAESNPVTRMITRGAAFASLPEEGSGTAVAMTHPRAAAIAATADILIVLSAQEHVVTGEWVKPGAIVFDFAPIVVGFKPHPTDPSRKVPLLAGGVDVDSAAKNAGTIVPIPGGTGPALLGLLVEQAANVALST